MDVNLTSQGRQNVIIKSDISEGMTSTKQVGLVNEKVNLQNSDSSNSNKTQVSIKDAQKAADKINKLLEDKNTHIELEPDKNFKYVTIMKVIDNNTNKVINQIPSKQIMDMIAQFCEMAGLILDKKA